MAFGDFLSTGIGGTTPINQNTMMSNTAGQPIGPTWGTTLGTAMQVGSKPGSTTPMLGRAVQRQGATQALPGMSAPALPQSAAEKQAAGSGDDSLSMILGALLKVLAI